MKCERCGKYVATYHKITDINGERCEEHLCSKCANELGENKFTYFGGGSLIKDFLEPFAVPTKRLFCENCLTTLDDFLNTGYVGCENCYEHFKEQMDSILKDTQAGIRHKGKKLNLNLENTVESKVATLKQKLNAAVKEERYEDAAKIKKEIDELEGGNKSE